MPVAYIVAVACLHVAAGVLLVVAMGHWPMLVGFAGLAYALGMRHGFDADHIVAIDGTTRSLLAQRQRAQGVGFFFSLGHSTVVLLLALWIAHATEAAGRFLPTLRAIGGDVGLAASSAFMLLTAVLNLMIFRDTLHAADDPSASNESPRGGVMARLLGRVIRLVRRAPQMYFVGFAFGLGFDTASEVALLAIAATVGAHALPMLAVLVLPISFAAGMALVDTAEGMFMVRAYSWAQDEPARRARYNLVVTGFTAVAAVMVGAMEIANLSWLGGNVGSTVLGAAIAATFPMLWMIAALNAHVRRKSSVLQQAGSPPRRSN